MAVAALAAAKAAVMELFWVVSVAVAALAATNAALAVLNAALAYAPKSLPLTIRVVDTFNKPDVLWNVRPELDPKVPLSLNWISLLRPDGPR